MTFFFLNQSRFMHVYHLIFNIIQRIYLTWISEYEALHLRHRHRFRAYRIKNYTKYCQCLGNLFKLHARKLLIPFKNLYFIFEKSACFGSFQDRCIYEFVFVHLSMWLYTCFFYFETLGIQMRRKLPQKSETEIEIHTHEIGVEK